MARKNADTNSDKSSERAVALTLILIATSCRRDPGEMQHAGDDDHHRQRQWQENLPAEPHQLVVAVARHDRLRPPKQEEHKKNLDREPHPSRPPGERPYAGAQQTAPHKPT